jgi:excisionase family DNA binding protein
MFAAMRTRAVIAADGKIKMRKIRNYKMPEPEKLGLTLDEVAALTSLGLASIRNAIACGQLPAQRFGRRVIIKRADVVRFLERLPSSR